MEFWCLALRIQFCMLVPYPFLRKIDAQGWFGQVYSKFVSECREQLRTLNHEVFVLQVQCPKISLRSKQLRKQSRPHHGHSLLSVHMYMPEAGRAATTVRFTSVPLRASGIAWYMDHQIHIGICGPQRKQDPLRFSIRRSPTP